MNPARVLRSAMVLRDCVFWRLARLTKRHLVTQDSRAYAQSRPATTLNDRPKSASPEVFRVDNSRRARPVRVERHELSSAEERRGEEDRVLPFFGHRALKVTWSPGLCAFDNSRFASANRKSPKARNLESSRCLSRPAGRARRAPPEELPKKIAPKL